MIDENEYRVNACSGFGAESIFYIGLDYNEESVISFCSDLYKVYIGESHRRKEYYKNPKCEYKKVEDLIKALSYPVIYDEIHGYKVFKKISSGKVVKKILIQDKKNRLYSSDDIQAVYEY